MAEKSRKPTVTMRYWLAFLIVFLSACTASDKAEIHKLLDLRNTAISQKDMATYTQLLGKQYQLSDAGHVIKSMRHMFDNFDQIEMTSRDRRIQLKDDNHAICEQTYILRVLSDGQWRKIVQREQLKLRKENGAWKIISGL